MLSTDTCNGNQDGTRRTVVLRRQSDDSSRIESDALGRFGGGRPQIGDQCFDLLSARRYVGAEDRFHKCRVWQPAEIRDYYCWEVACC